MAQAKKQQAKQQAQQEAPKHKTDKTGTQPR